jgi:hypothetical protein
MDKDETKITGGGAGHGEEMSEAEIDKNLNGSFPASDPPSWTLGTDHREKSESAEDKSTGSNGEE